jgi:ArsR family transcriptional regulator, arsenate/arsenite/antimonite-responsive transcriptional repressor
MEEALLKETLVVKSLLALAQPLRLRAFRALVVAGCEGLTPSRMADQLAVPASTLSFHLKELVHAGLISQTREGRNLIYRAQFTHMAEVLDYLTRHCCQGQPCMPANGLQHCATEGQASALSPPVLCDLA